MSDTARRSRLGKHVNGILQAETTAFHQVANNKISRPVEAIVTMYSNQRPARLFPIFCVSTFLLSGSDLVHQRNEAVYLLGGGWDLRHGGKFVVMDSCAFQTSRVINRLVLGDVDDVADDGAVASDEFSWTVYVVDFAKRLHGAEDGFVGRTNGIGNGDDGLPFGEVLDVPFAFAGEVLELPGEGKATGDVVGEEVGDEAGEGASRAWTVEEGVVGGSGHDGGLDHHCWVGWLGWDVRG